MAAFAVAIVGACTSSIAFAGLNPFVNLPLHAKPTSFETV